MINNYQKATACQMKFFLSLSICLFTNIITTAQNNQLPVIKSPAFKKDTISIVKFGAVDDGITLNTKMINDAIDACNKKGGGVVLVPKGMWLTGPIVLKSNVNLHLAKNALLRS